MSFNREDIDFFTRQSEDIAAVGQHLALSKKSMLADVATLREHFGTHGRAVAELLKAQRSAAGKFPAHWLTDSDAAQQATPELVADSRIDRFQKAGITTAVDVTCSIGTEGHVFTNWNMNYIGADIDPIRLAMARHNLGPDTQLLRADATKPALDLNTSNSVIIADPARRAGGKRITNPAQLLPPLPELIDAWPQHHMAIKCAPGIDYSEWPGLVSVVSIDGAVKEACLYTPGLSAGKRREAVFINTRSYGGTPVFDRLTDLDPELDESNAARPPGKYLIDPDGAIVRAGLVRHYAARESLWQLDPRIAYLTGDRIPEGTSGFEILDIVPLKEVKAAMAALDAGSVEILVRGVDVDPDELRKKLKLKGKTPRALVVTRIGRDGVGIVCNARYDG